MYCIKHYIIGYMGTKYFEELSNLDCFESVLTRYEFVVVKDNIKFTKIQYNYIKVNNNNKISSKKTPFDV